MKTLVVTLLLLAGAAQAAPFHLDPSHMEAGFSVKHLMISNVKGRFDKVTGSFDYDSAKKQIKDIVVEIDTNSVNTNEKDRDTHLRSPDFFDAAHYPKMTFKSDKVEFDGKKGKAMGHLTIRDKTKPVTLDFVSNGEIEFMGTTKVAFSATTKIDRKEFGLTWNKKLDKGGVAVGDEITISIDGEANKVVPAKAKK
jgi:polyisoprenoid-binding protein YceI